MKTNSEINKSETEFRHKFATETLTQEAEDYHISRWYATCEICIRELLFAQ